MGFKLQRVQSLRPSLEDLAIFEYATLGCKKRDINTPEVRAALDMSPRWREELAGELQNDS